MGVAAPESVAVTATIEPAVNSVRLEITVPAGHNQLSISRAGPSRTSAYVRGFQSAPGAGEVIARDFEAPIGVPLAYTVTTWNDTAPETTDSGTVTIELPDQGCDDTWLTDLARPTNTQRIVLEALDELAYLVPSGVHDILGRRTPIVSSDIANAPTFELSFLTDTEPERENARATLGNGVPILLRTPPANGIGNLYFATTGWREQRIIKPAREPARRFVVACVQVDRPDTSLYLPLAPATYQSVKDTFATYALLLAERDTYDAMLYDYSGDAPGDIVPWPPVDV